MPAWSLAFGGTLTDEQVQQITTYLRSLEAEGAERAELAEREAERLVRTAASGAQRPEGWP